MRCRTTLIGSIALLATALVGASTVSADEPHLSSAWLAETCISQMQQGGPILLSNSQTRTEEQAAFLTESLAPITQFQGMQVGALSQNDYVAFRSEDFSQTGSTCQAVTLGASRQHALAARQAASATQGFRLDDGRSTDTENINIFSIRGVSQISEESYAFAVLTHWLVDDEPIATQIMAVHIPRSPAACEFFPENCDVR